MGDPRRFDAFADVIEREFAPLRSASIADVAGGKGHLQAALRGRGFDRIVSWDKRKKYATPRRCYRYGYFDFRSAPRDYAAVVGMHPDEGTDHIICYAVKHRVPFAVCPCCIKPSAAEYKGWPNYAHWCRWLTALARAGRFSIATFTLPIKGCAHVIVGRPA